MLPFIVFEGIDGAGKTTLAKMLALEIGALLITTPPKPLGVESVRRLVDEQTSVETRFLYYLAGDSLASDIVREARKSRFVVCDRYIHSTIIGHKLLGLSATFDLDQFVFEQPDISFFIFVSDGEERRRRIEGRGVKTQNDVFFEEEGLQKKYMDYYLRRDDFFPLDTNKDTPEDSLAKIKNELVKRGLITT